MNSTYLTFLKRILFFTLAIAAVVLFANHYLPAKFTSPAVPFLIPFFFSITLIFHYLQLKAINKTFARFTASYMLLTFSKLFLLLIFLLIYVFQFPNEAIPFIVWYFLLYIFYTMFEAISLQNIKKD